MWRSLAGRHRLRSAAIAAGLLLVAAGCGEDASDRSYEEPASPAEPAAPRAEGEAPAHSAESAETVDTGDLARMLERAGAAESLPDTEKRSLEEAMERLLAPAAGTCEGCQARVSYIDEPGRGDYFRCEVTSSAGEPVADLHLFHRPEVPAEAVASWARRELGGHPASGLAGEHLFVWPGRFEIRAFARSQGVRAEERLEGLLQTLPLDALARL